MSNFDPDRQFMRKVPKMTQKQPCCSDCFSILFMNKDIAKLNRVE